VAKPHLQIPIHSYSKKVALATANWQIYCRHGRGEMEAVYLAVSWYHHHQGTTFVRIDVDGPQERLIMHQQTIFWRGKEQQLTVILAVAGNSMLCRLL